ncbi:hypothetical protein [Paenibacillus sp. Leaf72]|uniref:hypothetical protein n=1 Tax=Paenibacillus sp. Leaf72 TaxID=1736234 RepID=UPI0006F9F88B|nr:hypothetical protein [Paenibacillus sp. Leaf72]KQO17254.1 hypothetical protein ASF12_00730 [Paenibacillus sp. Leaf72]
METLNRSIWNGLPSQEKEIVLKMLLEKLPEGFEYKGLETFERYGSRMETGVYEYEGYKFVYVPGDKATLGWDRWEQGLDAATAEDFQATLDDFGVEDRDAFIRDQMSLVREAQIGALLVECETHSLGWYEVELDDEDLAEDEDFQEELKKFKLSTYSEYERHQNFRFVRDGEEIIAYLFNDELDADSVAEQIEQSGFSLPTEDEWEYLYGGGCRTLYPWGDSFDYGMKLRHFEELAEGESRPYDLELPNAFGICFSGDPYQYEMTLKDAEFFPKGGDGGSLVCGGTGPVVGYLPAAAVYYRDPNAFELDFEDIIGNLRFRRIIRL